jgi:heme/copper-type cytochrome/quinol oxidase subunit 1
MTEKPFTSDPSIDYWILALLVTGFGSIATGLNLVVTVIKLRAPGMTVSRMPVFVWMSAITGVLILLAIPTLTAAQFMLLFDRYLGSHFFDPSIRGDPLLWQHLFWWFGHPEVYIMALPAFGILSEVIPVFSRKPLFGYVVVVGSGIAIAFYSMLVWAHHMFAVGLGLIPDAFFGATSMIIAVPTGIKIFSWLATMWGGRIHFTTAMLFATSFLLLFTIGGITGVHFAMVPVDWQTTDTYYVVAHMHYVLFAGSYFAIVAAIYYWFPKVTGRLLDEGIGRWHFWLTFVGANLTFFPMHVVGLMGMARRVYTYPPLPGWGEINFTSTVGAFIVAASVLVLMWNIGLSLRTGATAGDNPWNAWTLEWATTSPPPVHNFITLPPIHSARPLWDLAHPTDTSAEKPAAPLRVFGEFAKSLPTTVVGMLTFLLSEVVFFGALIVAFIEYRTRDTSGPGPHDLDIVGTAIFSTFLFASSGSIVLAERSLDRKDQRGFRFWWLATIVLGVAFIIGQATEYLRLYADRITISTNLFTSSFFTLTGFHGLHVSAGLAALAVVAVLALLTRNFPMAGRGRTAIHAISIYWHFVDLVWLVVFSVVYLWAAL